jgi:large subunit ribosomal protein L29
MEAEKIRNTTDAELKHQERELNDQLFKLKFQMNMGQTESLKKIRGLRKDIARVKTILRERELGIVRNGAAQQKAAPAAEAAPVAAPAKKATGKAAKAKTRTAAGKSRAAASKTRSEKK